MTGDEAAAEAVPIWQGSWLPALRYTRDEWRRGLLPSIGLMALVALVLLAWGLTREVGEDVHAALPDVGDGGDFTLDGAYREAARPYGPQAKALNLTLLEGDRLVLRYTASGPVSGVQVRLQHPLQTSDGVDGAGGTDVHASSVGTDGSMEFVAVEPGAYQLYFVHPAAFREKDGGGDPGFRSPARVSWDLVVERGDRLQR